MTETVNFVKLIDANGSKQDVKLYVHYKNANDIYMTLMAPSLFIENEQSSYIQALNKILKQLPEGSQLLFKNKLHVERNGSLEIIQIKEYVSSIYLESIEDYNLVFNLECSYLGDTFKVSAVEDFSIALQKLKDILNLDILICAYCLQGEFMSTGGEDLRHGWYCLRRVENRKISLPWFRREEEFEKAIPNLSAFHWCPKFTKTERYL